MLESEFKVNPSNLVRPYPKTEQNKHQKAVRRLSELSLLPSLTIWIQSLEKEQANSCRLSSNIHMYTVIHTCMHTHTC